MMSEVMTCLPLVVYTSGSFRICLLTCKQEYSRSCCVCKYHIWNIVSIVPKYSQMPVHRLCDLNLTTLKPWPFDFLPDQSLYSTSICQLSLRCKTQTYQTGLSVRRRVHYAIMSIISEVSLKAEAECTLVCCLR